jgi:molybdopterin adenylyltransferase
MVSWPLLVSIRYKERVGGAPQSSLEQRCGAAFHTTVLLRLELTSPTDRRYYYPNSLVATMTEPTFIPLAIAVLVVSDTRTEADDVSGQTLVERLQAAGHHLATKRIVPDNIYRIRATVSEWIADDTIHAILTTGGTGVTGRDGTPEAIAPLLDKALEGFGEVFRMLSYQDIKTSTIQSRAIAGVANGTYLFCLPGSASACRLAWDALIKEQLDSRTKPCNLVQLMPRLREI